MLTATFILISLAQSTFFPLDPLLSYLVGQMLLLLHGHLNAPQEGIVLSRAESLGQAFLWHRVQYLWICIIQAFFISIVRTSFMIQIPKFWKTEMSKTVWSCVLWQVTETDQDPWHQCEICAVEKAEPLIKFFCKHSFHETCLDAQHISCPFGCS